VEAEKAETVFNDYGSTLPDHLAALAKYEKVLDPSVVSDVKMRIGERLWKQMGERDNPFPTVVERAVKDGDFEIVYEAAKQYLGAVDKALSQPRSGRPSIADYPYVQQVISAFENAFYHETKLLDQRALEAQAKLGGNLPPELEPLLKGWYKRVIREEVARTPGEPVRFATADTVAKVEGWPTRNWVDEVRNGEASLRGMAGQESHPIYQRAASDLAEAREKLAKEGPGEHLKEAAHQLIYDRYRNGVESFLKSEFRAQPYTDAKGHTWLEVPPQPTNGPGVRMFGRADTKTLVGLAVASGAAITLDVMQDDPSFLLDAIGGAGAFAAVVGRKGTATAMGGGAAVAAFLSSEETRTRNSVLTGAFVGIARHAASKNKVLAKWAEGTTQAAETILKTVSGELRDMSSPLLRRFTQHERNLKIREHDAMERIFATATGLVKLPEAAREAVDVALFNGDRAAALKAVAGRPELVKALRQTFDYIDETGAELARLGLVKRVNIDHYPRIVTDLDGLMAHLGKEGGDYLGRKLMQAANESIRKTGDPLSDIEMSRIVNQHLLAAVRHGEQGGQSGILKKRSIEEITKDILPFYATAADSIALYARAATREIERARFFGKDLVQNAETLAVRVDASVGKLILDERAKGKLSHEQLQRLEQITKARFGPGERSGHWLTQTYKNIVHTLLLGNPFSAMVQFGDAAVATAIHGVLPTIRAVGSLVIGRHKWKLADQGLINHITEDLVRGERDPLRIGPFEVSTAKFLDKTLKYSGFSLVDEFGKLVHMNAISAKFEALARSAKGIKELERNYGEYFGADMPQLIQDLRAGKKTTLTGELNFRELSDVQPISKIEMPLGYIANPNARVLYTLKSFMLKQMNLVRERGFREIAKGDAASIYRGASFLTRYSLVLGMSGASLSFINDWLLGREPRFGAEEIAENVFKTFGWGAYAVDQARKGKALQAAANVVIPPYKLFEEIYDTSEELEKFNQGNPKANPKGVMYFPLVGKAIYNRGLGGAERSEARREREERKRAREEAE